MPKKRKRKKIKRNPNKPKNYKKLHQVLVVIRKKIATNNIKEDFLVKKNSQNQ